MACQRQHPGRRGIRLAALGCALAAAAGAGWLAAAPAPAAPAAASDAARAHPWIAITSMTPTIAKPKGKVTVTGIIANPTGAPLAGASVQLWSSRLPMASRPSMNSYLAGQPSAPLVAPVTGAQPSRVPAHAARSWSLTLDVAQVGMRAFGVYPLAAQLTSGTGTELDVARTFLPFWPGKPAARTVKPLKIGWVWPLIDVPQRGACAALLTDVAAMTAPYRVGARQNCAGGKKEPPSHAASAWLSGVKAVAGGQDFFVTPYADVDLAALAHRGLVSELTAAFNDGHAAAKKILGRTQRATPDTA